MSTSAILGLPNIASQQAQPEVTHNESLVMLESLLGGVTTIGDNAPPGSPAEGVSYVVGTSPTGAWSGWSNHVAIYTAGGWKFCPGYTSAGAKITMGAAHEGMRVWLKGAGSSGLYRWTGSAWVAVTIPQTPATQYGQLLVTNNAAARAMTAAVDATLNTASDYVKIDTEWDDTPHGLQNNVTQGADSLTIQVAGVYRVEMWATVSSGTLNTSVAFKYAKNGTLLAGRRPWWSCGAANNKVCVSAYGFISCAVGDVFTHYMASDKSANVTIHDMVFSLQLLREA